MGTYCVAAFDSSASGNLGNEKMPAPGGAPPRGVNRGDSAA